MSDYKELLEELQGSVAHMERFGILTSVVRREEIKAVADAIEQLVKERDAAVKCIEDIETYLQWGAPQYAYKVIEEWRGVRDADS